MNPAEKKTITKRLRELRADWRIWRKAIVQDPQRIEEFLTCPTHPNRYRQGQPVTCGDPTCEGCMATAYRNGRMVEIEQEAGPLKARLDEAAAS